MKKEYSSYLEKLESEGEVTMEELNSLHLLGKYLPPVLSTDKVGLLLKSKSSK